MTNIVDDHPVFRSFVLVLVVEIQRDYRVLLTKGPPPTETRESGKNEAGVPFPPELLDEVQDRVQGLLRTSIVRADADVAAELEYGGFLGRIKSGLLEDHHPLRFPENVVVEGALRYTVLRRRLGEPHLLGYHGLDGLLEIVPRPRRHLQLQQARIFS